MTDEKSNRDWTTAAKQHLAADVLSLYGGIDVISVSDHPATAKTKWRLGLHIGCAEWKHSVRGPMATMLAQLTAGFAAAPLLGGFDVVLKRMDISSGALWPTARVLFGSASVIGDGSVFRNEDKGRSIYVQAYVFYLDDHHKPVNVAELTASFTREKKK